MSMKGEVIGCGSASDGSSTEGQIEESTKASSHRNSSHNSDVPSLYYEEPSLLFDDGCRRIDFVLVYKPSLEKDSPHENIRQAFEVTLKDEGLELEHVHQCTIGVNFVKIHAPWDVLTRYAEIMKMKMPMKEVPEFQYSRYATKKLKRGISGVCHTISNLFGYKIPKFQQFTAEYTRDKECLFDVPARKEDFFNPDQRAQIVDFILNRKRFINNGEGSYAFGITQLINDNVYEAAFPLREGECDSSDDKAPRKWLMNNWASFSAVCKKQPLDDIKEYFGVKIGLYFAWLEFYTYMLIPASVVGVLCFLYGCLTLSGDAHSKDICEDYKDVILCPQCDVESCRYRRLGQTCTFARITHLFDNGATVFFALFMSLWAGTFFELWKRYSPKITHHWDMTGFDTLEEHPRPEYLAKLSTVKKRKVNFITGVNEPYVSFWKRRIPCTIFSCSMVLQVVTVALVAVVSVISYRISIQTVLYFTLSGNQTLTSMVTLTTLVTAALLNLVCIMIFNLIYRRIATYLTELEVHRTQTEYENSLTLKMFLLQFVNYYSSIFYIAFFKGRFVGYPGHYNSLFGYRQEECVAGGCLLELSLQLAIIMVGKQSINAVLEMGVPWLLRVYKKWSVHKKGECVHENHAPTQWESDYNLINQEQTGLFGEYLEMVLQFGFVTIFVVAFPLAPLFALLNNIVEIRLDARKFITFFQRPVAQRVKNIGIWYRILDSVGKISVITNALIIAFTSSFIDQIFYSVFISPDGSLNGFLNFTLSDFNVSDFPVDMNIVSETNTNVEYCKYQDYREPPTLNNKYEYKSIYWQLITARLAFIVIIECLLFIIISLIRWMIPDIPKSLKLQIRRENYIINNMIIEHELRRAKELGIVGSRKTSGFCNIDSQIGSISKRSQRNCSTFDKGV
ncbi:anoctamin-1-like isoform X2 [Tachypleus tridentatus]